MVMDLASIPVYNTKDEIIPAEKEAEELRKDLGFR